MCVYAQCPQLVFNISFLSLKIKVRISCICYTLFFYFWIQEAIKNGFTADKWISSVLPMMDGKGGGKKECAQASGHNYRKLDDIMDIARRFTMKNAASTTCFSFLNISFVEIFLLRKKIVSQFVLSHNIPYHQNESIFLFGNAETYFICNDDLKGGSADNIYERAIVLQWIYFADSMLWPLQNIQLKSDQFDLENDKNLFKLLSYLNDTLEDKTFLVNERISLADIAVFTSSLSFLKFETQLKVMENLFIHFSRWFFTILNHPFVKNCI